MRPLLLSLLLLLGAALPAEAHRLKVFAAIEGDRIAGYAFFIGGGRAQGAAWVARMGDRTLAEGRTDAEGGFVLTVPAVVTADIGITVDTQEGHIAMATLPAGRFGDGPAPAPPPAATPAAGPPAALDQAALARLVEGAVQRQVAPLEAQIAEMQDRLRLVDVISGVMFIAGLAGVALWLRGRRAA